jgi:DNA repair protein RadC
VQVNKKQYFASIMKLLDLAKHERPRERMQQLGSDALSDAELLAIILQNGSSKINVVEMSNVLLSKYSLQMLSKISLHDLQKLPGIGLVKAMQIHAVFALHKRIHNYARYGIQLKHPKQVFAFAKPKMQDYDKECFMILHLDSKNRVIKEEISSIGILNAALIHPREIFRSAIKENANSIILVHNHPSGDCSPSIEDQEITEQLFETGNIVGIKVIDHVIIGEHYYSFREHEN